MVCKYIHRVEDDTSRQGANAVRRRDHNVTNDVEYHYARCEIMKGMCEGRLLTDYDIRGAAGGDIGNLGNYRLSTRD